MARPLLRQQLFKLGAIESNDRLAADDRDRGGHAPEGLQFLDGAVVDHDVALGELDAPL